MNQSFSSVSILQWFGISKADCIEPLGIQIQAPGQANASGLSVRVQSLERDPLVPRLFRLRLRAEARDPGSTAMFRGLVWQGIRVVGDFVAEVRCVGNAASDTGTGGPRLLYPPAALQAIRQRAARDPVTQSSLTLVNASITPALQFFGASADGTVDAATLSARFPRYPGTDTYRCPVTPGAFVAGEPDHDAGREAMGLPQFFLCGGRRVNFSEAGGLALLRGLSLQRHHLIGTIRYCNCIVNVLSLLL